MTLSLPSILSAVIRAVPSVLPYLSETTRAAIKAVGYDGIRLVMRSDIFGAVFGYLSGGSLSDARSRMATAVSKGYIETVDAAYQDGGGELPIDEDTAAWARGALDAQLTFVDQLFDDLKEIRKAGDFDAGAIANLRAEGYASALDGSYAEAKMRGSKNITLEFGGSDGKENCDTCARLKGQRHKISWWIDNGLIPGQSGNENYICRGYNCQHYLFNPRTGERFDG